jgi:hypothetical protein
MSKVSYLNLILSLILYNLGSSQAKSDTQSNHNISQSVNNDDPAMSSLKDEISEYETMIEKKEKLISDMQVQLENSRSEIDAIESDHQNRRKKAQEIILDKDKEIDRLKKHKKKIDEQYKSLKKAFDQISNPNQTSQVTRTDGSHEGAKPELPKEFFDDSSSSDGHAIGVKITSTNPPAISDTVVVSSNSNALEKAMSYQIEEQFKSKIGGLNTKISDLENLVKYHMTREQDMIDKLNDLQRCKTRESVNIEYVKNVFVSYIEYKAMKNDKEAKTCEQVLYTALRLSPNEIKEVDRLRKKYKNYKFWKFLPQSSKTQSKKDKELLNLIASSTRMHQDDEKRDKDQQDN